MSLEAGTKLGLLITSSDRDLVVSPDENHVVYVSGDGSSGSAQVMIRAIDQLDAVPARGLIGTRPMSRQMAGGSPLSRPAAC